MTAMFFSGGLTLLAGTYFRFVARRVEIRPEDYEDAEIEDGAGELGFFSPHSWWPISVAAGARSSRAASPPGTCGSPSSRHS